MDTLTSGTTLKQADINILFQSKELQMSNYNTQKTIQHKSNCFNVFYASKFIYF